MTLIVVMEKLLKIYDFSFILPKNKNRKGLFSLRMINAEKIQMKQNKQYEQCLLRLQKQIKLKQKMKLILMKLGKNGSI